MDHNNSEPARERLRAHHRVRLVQPQEEGTAAGDLPAGVYGFTASPGLAAPLFAARRYRNFEIHHRPEGDIAIVGFAHVRDVERLTQASGGVEITVYPDVEGEATAIIAISYLQIVQHRQYSIRNSPGMSLVVAAVRVPDRSPQPNAGPQVAT